MNADEEPGNGKVGNLDCKSAGLKGKITGGMAAHHAGSCRNRAALVEPHLAARI